MSQPFLFDIPQSIEDYLVVLDEFIEQELCILYVDKVLQTSLDYCTQAACTPKLFAK